MWPEPEHAGDRRNAAAVSPGAPSLCRDAGCPGYEPIDPDDVVAGRVRAQCIAACRVPAHVWSGEVTGLAKGKRFAPEHPLWGTLKSVKRSGSHLFLSYAFEAKEHV